MAITGRPRGFDRDAALEAAMLLFWRKGFAAASMNDLCDAMSIRSPSLYAAFGSKEALYLEAVEHYVQTIGPPVWDKLAEGTTARAGVENLLLAGTETLPESGAMPAGCMAMLAAVSDEWPAAITDVVGKVRLEVLGKLRSRLKTGVAEGELPASTDIDGLSRFYLSVFQGMAIQARDGATPAELRSIATAAMAAWPSNGRK
ncbi:TetR/AcrR family transcriptional regulator [Bradyrhizobium canariense]|uniref:Transcriptional regulator, TetR family n=1 Tax=Bradyrhizobium canariense TaxID=255045 RepID=A0A1H2BD27_9BRAD|nr:TetR/AcrR family transcriptional regulator [Bradyrhizobium canariense]SDT55706.1 transcriptional regulator, TetR family [Bradyrhizobium canariense]